MYRQTGRPVRPLPGRSIAVPSRRVALSVRAQLLLDCGVCVLVESGCAARCVALQWAALEWTVADRIRLSASPDRGKGLTEEEMERERKKKNERRKRKGANVANQEQQEQKKQRNIEKRKKKKKMCV